MPEQGAPNYRYVPSDEDVAIAVKVLAFHRGIAQQLGATSQYGPEVRKCHNADAVMLTRVLRMLGED